MSDIDRKTLSPLSLAGIAWRGTYQEAVAGDLQKIIAGFCDQLPNSLQDKPIYGVTTEQFSGGFGYFIGMVVGLICALAFPPLFKIVLPGVAPDILPLYLFPIVLILSGSGCIFGSIYTAPEDMERLKSFYRNVRPWGFWGPVLKAVQEDDPTYTRNPYFKRDMMNIAIGTVLQTALVALPIFIVIKAPFGIVTTAIITGVAAFTLYNTWYKNLLDWPSEEMAREAAAKQA